MRNYRWYPKLENGEPNLNPFWAVFYRRVNQWCRRLYWRFRPGRYLALVCEQEEIGQRELLTEKDRECLAELLWMLGQAPAFQCTSDQQERLNQLLVAIIQKGQIDDREEKINEADH